MSESESTWVHLQRFSCLIHGFSSYHITIPAIFEENPLHFPTRSILSAHGPCGYRTKYLFCEHIYLYINTYLKAKKNHLQKADGSVPLRGFNVFTTKAKYEKQGKELVVSVPLRGFNVFTAPSGSLDISGLI